MRAAEFKEGQEVRATLWITSGSVRKTKAGDPYWEGHLQDATGSVPAKLWDTQGGQRGRVEKLSGALSPGRAVLVRGKVDSFQGALQLTLLEVEACPEEDADPGLFSPRSDRPVEEMLEEFRAIRETVADPDYRSLLEMFASDRDLLRGFSRAPAAKTIHHAWIGGLLEHSLSLARAVMALAPLYPALDLDLLLVGCFLHDAGKAFEISSAPGFDYTADGHLHGHIYMGARLAERLIESRGSFPREKRRRLIHLILSHQGDRSLGFGSGVDPSTPEAIFFHHLDNLDAKVQNCLSAIGCESGADGSREFTDPRRSGPLRKSYYLTRRGAETGAPPPVQDSGRGPKKPLPPEGGGSLFG